MAAVAVGGVRTVPPSICWAQCFSTLAALRISSGIFFFFKYLIRTPPQTCYFRTLMEAGSNVGVLKRLLGIF